MIRLGRGALWLLWPAIILNVCYIAFKFSPSSLDPSSSAEYHVLKNDSWADAENKKGSLDRPRTAEFDLRAAPPTILRSSHTSRKIIYVWCNLQTFHFVHYLSVLSAIRYLHADSITFYFNGIPATDASLYHTWLTDLINDYPFVIFSQINETGTARACHGPGRANLKYIRQMLKWGGGGTYANETTIFLPHGSAGSLGRHTGGEGDIVVTSSGSTKGRRSSESRSIAVMSVSSESSTPTYGSIGSCQRKKEFVLDSAQQDKPPVCLSLAGVELHPKDIWALDNRFGALCRTLFYGSPAVAQPVPDYNNLIPNIAHVVWLNGGEMSFLFYLGVLSLIYVGKVDMVYLHVNTPPKGRYWNLIKDHPKLQIVRRHLPPSVYGHKVTDISHISDILRVDIMIKYGGIYVDADVIVLKPLDAELRGYDAVASYDWYPQKPFPDVINFGVCAGKRNAPYWHKFQQSMKWFVDSDWLFNGLRQPYRVLERHPDLIHIDPHLQIICFFYKCHPTFWPDYHNDSVSHLTSDLKLDWRRDSFAFHWTYPTPPDLESPEKLVLSLQKPESVLFSEIGLYILKQANMLDYFKQPAANRTEENG